MVPKWKKWLSYLFEQHIESASSDYNEHMYVSLNKGRYQLSTANAIYSYGDLYTNFFNTFQAFNWQAYPIQECLILGLGLGSIPQMLEQNFDKKIQYTAIEIDEEVIDLAYRYVLSDLESPIEMIAANAAYAVYQLPEQSYDLICIDVFDDDQIPAEIQSIDFLKQVKSLLSPNGVVLFNSLAATEQDRKRSKHFFNKSFKKVFPHAYLLDVKGNYMLVNPAEAVK